MDDMPIRLGLCRRCSKLRIYNETTLDGDIRRRVFYCRALMHEVVGKGECNEYTEMEE